MKYNIPGFLFEIFNNKIFPQALSLSGIVAFKGMETRYFPTMKNIDVACNQRRYFKFRIKSLETNTQLFFFFC